MKRWTITKRSFPKPKPTYGAGMGLACVLCLMFCVLCSSNARAADVYYSVGTSSADLKTASTVTVTGGNTVTFSAGQPDNIGIGDRITYNTNMVAYISGKTSPTVFTAVTALGGFLTNGGPWTLNSIRRSFNSLNNAVNTGASPNPSNANYLDTADLTSGPFTLHIICYGDANADTAAADISGWTTDPANNVNIYPSAQARNKGRWDAGAYRLVIAGGNAITVSDDNISISGLQIELSGTASYGIVSGAGNNNFSISGNIIYYSGANPAGASGVWVNDGGNAGRTGRIWNNILYDFLGTNNSGITVGFSGGGSKVYVYNNTVYNNTVGINDASGTGSIVAKNNLVYWNGDNYGGSGVFDAASANNLSGPNTDAQAPAAGAQDGVAVRFMNIAGGDFRLAALDVAAQNSGTDLSADTSLAFSDDIEGQRRGRVWDIGADERAARALSIKSPNDPIVIQLGNGTVDEDFELTFTNAAGGLDVIKKGGYGNAWGSDLINSGTLFTVGGESGSATHTLLQNAAGEVIVRKERSGIVSHYHIYPSGRIVLDAAGASSIAVNQISVFSEYSNGVSHTGGYHAYVDLIETASASSDDYGSPDTNISMITGEQNTDSMFDYGNDGFEEGRGVYPVIAAAGNATVDFNGDNQTRYKPVLLLEEFYPKTQSASLSFYWDAADATASGNELWAGTMTSLLTAMEGLRGTAQKNDTAGDYASVQTALNMADPGTLSLWVRSSSAANPSSDEVIFFADTDINLYFNSSGYLNFRINSGVDLTYSADVYDGKWHQVTCVWDYAADEYALYVDGKPRAASTASYIAPTPDAAMYFTARDNTGANRFSGLIDEVRIYDDIAKPTGHTLFHSRMDAASDMTSPQVGNAGTVEGTTSFNSGVNGNAAVFDANGEYMTFPSSGNISASSGTLEMRVRSNAAVNPSVSEQIFFGDPDFNIFFDANGRINFEMNGSVYLTDTVDTYDSLWHHVSAMWDYASDQYFLYVDGRQTGLSGAGYNAPSMDATMYLGASDASDTSRYNGLIDDLLIYDDMILPFGAYYVPDAWGDMAGKPDPTVTVYWDADSTALNIGEGSASLNGSLAVGVGIQGLGLVNDSVGENASLLSAGNIYNEEGSLAFWARSAAAGNPAGTEYLFYGNTGFNVFFNASGYINFNINSGVTLQHAVDIYDGTWHYIRCTWDYTHDIYELFVDGVKQDENMNVYTAPVLDAALYVTAQNNSGANRFSGSLDEIYITNSRTTPTIATAYGVPVMQPQAGMPYAYRVDIGENLNGLANADLLAPLSGVVVSATHSPSEYTVEYLGDITATGSPSISGISAVQNAGTGNVTIQYTGEDPDNDTVAYVAVDCEYSLNSTDGSDGAWNDMTTLETTENFTSGGAVLSFVWNAGADTALYDGTVYARLKAKDDMGHESALVTTPLFSVDTLAPAGLGSFNVSGATTTLIALAWNSVTDDSWVNGAHYEIWYGTVQADVQNRSGTAAEWDYTDDSDMANRTTQTTTVTGLSANTTYFFKIWAVDGFANETTVADISGRTEEVKISRAYIVQIDPIYDAENDAVLITTSLLLRSGTIVTDLAGMALTYVGLLDNSGTLLSGNLNGAGDTVNGTTNAIFYTTWDPAGGLTEDTTYTIVSKISYNGEIYSGSKIINVGELGALTEDVSAVDSKVDILQTSVAGLDSKISVVSDAIDQRQARQMDLRARVTSDTQALAGNVGSILEDTSTTIPALVDSEVSAKIISGVQAEIVTRPTTVEAGATTSIRFRAKTGFVPTLTVYDPNNAVKISNAVMTEVGTTGIYERSVTFNANWGLGGFTVLVSEPSTGSVDSILVNIVENITSGAGGTASPSSISMDLLYSRVTNMDSDIVNLMSSTESVRSVTAGVGSDVDQLLDKLGAVSTDDGFDKEAVHNIIESIEKVIGEKGEQKETILGKISGLESALAGMGADAVTASSQTQEAELKAQMIREIAVKIAELLEKGDMEGAKEELLALGNSLLALKQNVEQIPGVVTADSLLGGVEETVNELNRLAAEKGIEGLIPPIEFGGDLSPGNPEDMVEVRNGVSELKSLMVEVRSVLDLEINQPIIHGWLEGTE